MTERVWREYVVHEMRPGASVGDFVDVLASNGDILDTVDAPGLVADLRGVGFPFAVKDETESIGECRITVAGEVPGVVANDRRMWEAGAVFLAWCEKAADDGPGRRACRG